MGSLLTVRSLIAWLTLSAYLFLAMGGATIVLCEGMDGHSGIELAHSEGSCQVLVGDAGVAPIVEGNASPACEDTSISTLVSAERTLPRSHLPGVVLLPAPLLQQRAWTAAEAESSGKVIPDPRPAAPSHLDVAQSIVLLI